MLCVKFPQAQYIYLSEVVHVVKAFLTLTAL